MSKSTSILWKLFLDETGKAPISSAEWVRTWFYGSDPAPAQLQLLAEAIPQLGTFRRVLRNLALGKMLEDGVGRADSGDAPLCDTTVREELLLAYIFLLCLQISRQPPLDDANELFSKDDAVFLKIGTGDIHAGGIGPPEWKEAILDIAQTIHSWLTSNYSIHGKSSQWPTIPELGLGILVSRTGSTPGQNMQFRNLRRFDGKYVDRLLPTLRALRSFGTGAPPSKIVEIREHHLNAVKHGLEFKNLRDEPGRLKDEQRQVFLSAYAMVIEYLAWLAASNNAPPGGDTKPTPELTIATIGSDMDALIGGKQAVSVRASARLPEWASKEIQGVALHQIKSAQKKTRTFPKMAVPLYKTTVRHGPMPVAVEVNINNRGDERTLSIRVPEHELPESMRWYEMELAAADTDDSGRTALHRIPLESAEPDVVESGAEAWASYQWPVPAAILAMTSDTGKVTLTSGSAFMTTEDGLGANVLIAISIA